MKTVKVVAAVICDSIKEKKLIFATARGYGESKGQWEFPGGKIEPGETPQEALVREIKEELDTLIRVGDIIGMAGKKNNCTLRTSLVDRRSEVDTI